ncbi:restriction endonuclease subunit S [Streptomyces sp. BYX5S]
MSTESNEIGTDVPTGTGQAELPTGWAWGTVGDLLVKTDAGKSFKCDPRPAAPDEWGIITVTAMTWGEFRPDENKALLDERLVNPSYEIHEGDVLVSRANTVEHVGAPVLVGEVRSRLLLSDKSIRFQPGLEVDRKWFTYWLRSPAVRKEVEAKASGTSDSMRNISQPDLKAISVPIPPAAEQQRITEALDRHLARLDSIDAALRAAQDQVNELRRACLVEAFAGRLVPQEPDDEPADDLLKRITTEREAAEAERKAIRRAAALARGKKREKPKVSAPADAQELPLQATETHPPVEEQTLFPEEFNA